MRSALRVGAGLLLAPMAAFSVAGCSCNAPNTFDQRYCEAYSDTPVGPAAVVIGVAFFALTILISRFMWRRGRSVPGDHTGGTGQQATKPPVEGAACATLERLIEGTTLSSRVLEGYDGRWAAELTFGTGNDADVYTTEWTTREAACLKALEEIERRGHVPEASLAP